MVSHYEQDRTMLAQCGLYRTMLAQYELDRDYAGPIVAKCGPDRDYSGPMSESTIPGYTLKLRYIF